MRHIPLRLFSHICVNPPIGGNRAVLNLVAHVFQVDRDLAFRVLKLLDQAVCVEEAMTQQFVRGPSAVELGQDVYLLKLPLITPLDVAIGDLDL